MAGTFISIIVSLIALVISIITLLQFRQERAASAGGNRETVPLQLQAYERLVLLCERIALPNLVSRVNEPQLTAQEMQVSLIQNIKQEFEYNASQQIYVSPPAWDAVRNLRDQNMLIINQVANLLPPDAKATDLNKHLLEVMLQNDQPLHIIVLDALNFEAKKLMR